MLKKDKNNRLTAPQKRAIASLVEGATKQQASACAGVTPSTLSRWLRDDTFRGALAVESDSAMGDTTTRLKASLAVAVDTIHDIMTDTSAPQSVRLRASIATIENAIKLLEFTALNERITALEQRIT